MNNFLGNQKRGGTTLRSNAYRLLVSREQAPRAQHPIPITSGSIAVLPPYKNALTLTKIPKIHADSKPCALHSYFRFVLSTKRSFLFCTLILLDRLGGDGSGGLGTVGGLNVGRRGGGRAPCCAARHAEGDGAARQERKDDRLNDFVNLLVAHRFQCMWVRYVVVPARGCRSIGCRERGR